MRLTTILATALMCCCLLIYNSSNAQKSTETITFENTPLNEVLAVVESKTEYKFFYAQDWLPEKLVSGAYTLTSLDDFLSQVLDETTLNYFIREEEGRIFLLQNSIVYDELPEQFFGITDTVQTVNRVVTNTNIPPPSFYDVPNQQQQKKYLPIKVGKSDKNNLKSFYQLSGSIVNTRTKEPIQDLAIRIQGSNSVTVTNENGLYAMEIPAGYNILELTAMGIESSVRPVIMFNDGIANFELNEGLQELDEVVVAADAINNVEDTQTGSEQITSEEAKDIPLVLGERNILEVAKALPGISSAGEGATGLNVRGGKTDQNLVLLDDAVIYNPTHFFGIFQALNPFTTERVNIYKGSIPVEFGGRLSSVLDIETKNGNSQKFAAEGSIGPVTGNLALEIPVKKDTSSLIIGARGAYADWILNTLDDEDLKNSSASFFDGIVKYNHRFNENSDIKFTGYYSRDGFSITSDSLYNYTNRLFSLKWNHQHSEKTRGALALANSDYQFGIDFDGEGNRDFELDYAINETALQYHLKTILSEKHRLTYGISSKFYSVNPGSIAPEGSESDIENFAIPDEQAVEGAIFLGDEIKLTDKLTIDLGVRYAFYAALGSGTQRTYEEGLPRNETTVNDTISYKSGELIETYGGPEGRISARYLLQPDLSIKASLQNSYQFLHTLSNNTTVSPIDTWKLSDLNLKPQTGYQASLGVFKNLNENMFELSLEGYYKRMQNVLDFKTGANLFLNEHVETEVLQGDGKAYGVEFLLKKNRGDLNGWLSYTYSRSFYRFDSEFSEERINDGSYFPSNFDKPHDISFIANYKLTRRFSFSMNFAYQTGRPVTYPVGTFRLNNADFVVFSDRNEFRIPDYYRLDLGFNVEGNHKKKKLAHSFITFQVYNVLGRNNPYSVFFVTEDGEVKALQSSIFAVPVPSITYNFKF